MRRILFVILLIVLSYSLTGPANYSGIEDKESLGYAPDKIIVKYKSHLNTSDIRSVQARAGFNARELTTHIHVVSVNPGKSITQSIAEAENDPDVEYAEPDYLRSVSIVPDDPYYSNQWALADIETPGAWDLSQGDPSVKIAIIDTGINMNHPDLVLNIYDGWDFVDNDNWAMDMNGHGTKVAGLAAARGNNGIGISGVSWGSAIMPLRAGNGQGQLFVSNIVQAIDYAVSHGARIINASYAGTAYSNAEYEAMSRAAAAGLLFVAAAGNYGYNLDCCPVYPAAYGLNNLITVASVNSSGLLSGFSDYGPTKAHVAAPGERLYSTTYPISEVFGASFSAGSSGWTLDKWSLSGAHSYSPGYSLSNSIENGKYQNNMYATAVSPSIDLTGAAGCRLQFELYGSSELNCDYLTVEVSVNGGLWSSRPISINNVSQPSISGSTLNTWKLAYVDFGEFDGKTSVKFRFTFTSDGVNTDEGFFIDDVKIMAFASRDGSYGTGSGTSFSAPQVAGLAALIWSKYPAYSADQVKNVIYNSVSKTESLKGKIYTGGRINAYRALSSPDPDTIYQPNASDMQNAPSCGSSAGTASGGGGDGGGGGCFIATAAFGSAMEPHVIELRKFRDKVLARFEAGRQFIRLYYRYSPPAANFISKSELMKTAIRDILLPVVIASQILLMPAWQLGIMALLVIVLMPFIIRRGRLNNHS